MRILATGDIHLGELTGPVVNGENARMKDTLRCMDFLAKKAVEEEVDAVLIAGDLFNKSKLWGDQMLKEINLATAWIRSITSKGIPVVLLQGTKNHDSDRAFENICNAEIPLLTVISYPEVVKIKTKSGILQVAGLPGFNKYQLSTDEQYNGLSPEETNRVASELLGQAVLGLGAQIDTSIPSALMAHYTVVGCELDNGQHVFQQADVVLPREALASTPFDLVCLGHIHRAQEVEHVGIPTYYCGAVNGITFNEEGQDKGFWIHELSTSPDIDRWVCKSSQFAKTPYRVFVTWECFKDEMYDWPALFADSPQEAVQLYIQEIEGCQDGIVRVHYKCDEETQKRMNHKAIEKALYDAGAFYVAEIKPVEIITTANRQEMTEDGEPLDNLSTYLEKEGFADDKEAILELAQPLIDMVSAKMPTGRLSGVFEPLFLEVKNYRSYREESFDFRQVSFATVNGPNGCGKSSFFMDAMCDCLYEEPREGELTGWISVDETVRSGSISFEFSMGASIWRVTRSRTKSGSVTLSLQEQVEGEWIDRSATRKDETQKKIVELLGMDAMTFRCCALIMQDQYGVFMDADKEERMSVLGNILGLGVYEYLHSLAKEKVTETNRELRMAKEKLADLDEKVKQKPELEANLKNIVEEIKELSESLTLKEFELQAAQSKASEMETQVARIVDLQGQTETLSGEINQKKQDIQTQQSKKERAQKILENEEQIMAKTKEYEEIKAKVLELSLEKPRLKQLREELSQLITNQTAEDSSLVSLGAQILAIKEALANREVLEKAAKEYQESLALLEQMDNLHAKWSVLEQSIRDISAKSNMAEAEYKVRENALVSEQDNLMSMAAMLDDSGCIDSEKASCKFLVSAKEAKTKLTALDERMKVELDKTEIEKLGRELSELVRQQADLNYSAEDNTVLRGRVNALRPQAEEAASLSSKVELLDNLKKQKDQAVIRKSQQDKQLEKTREEILSLEERLKDLPMMEERLPKLEQWAKAKEELPAAKQLVQTADETIQSLESEIKTKEEQKVSLEQTVQDLKAKTTALDDTKKTVDDLRYQIKALQDQKGSLLTQKGAIKSQLEALVKSAEERRELAKEMEPTAKRVTMYQTLATAFSVDGIPFSIVRSVVPELSRMANDILGQMTGGKMSLELRTERIVKSSNKEVNAIEIWISGYQGTLPYRSLSGGQRVRVALAVAFALADLKASRVGIKIGMLFVDEPSFQDAEGTEAYCAALETIAQRYNSMKVIAISHDPMMKARFPQNINVTNGDDGSKIQFVA